MPTCKFCLIEKPQEDFCKKKNLYLKYCKRCHLDKYYKPSPRKGDPNSKNSSRCARWKKLVKDRDGWKCQRCNGTNRLAAHHIIPWKVDEEKRFDIENGITLCGACHLKEEIKVDRRKPPEHTLFKKGMIPWSKGKKIKPHENSVKTQFKKGVSVSPETQFKKGHKSWCEGKKIVQNENNIKTQFKKGMIPWNKGLKLKDQVNHG